MTILIQSCCVAALCVFCCLSLAVGQMCIRQSDTIYSGMCLKICCVFHGHYFSLFGLFGLNQYCLSVAQWGNQPNVHFTLNTQHSLLPLSNSYYTQAFTAIPFGIPYYTPPFTATIEQFLLHSSIHCYH